jgi:hypothetical protein
MMRQPANTTIAPGSRTARKTSLCSLRKAVTTKGRHCSLKRIERGYRFLPAKSFETRAGWFETRIRIDEGKFPARKPFTGEEGYRALSVGKGDSEGFAIVLEIDAYARRRMRKSHRKGIVHPDHLMPNLPILRDAHLGKPGRRPSIRIAFNSGREQRKLRPSWKQGTVSGTHGKGMILPEGEGKRESGHKGEYPDVDDIRNRALARQLGRVLQIFQPPREPHRGAEREIKKKKRGGDEKKGMPRESGA